MPLRYLRFKPPPETVAIPPELPQFKIYRQPEIVVKLTGPPPSATGYRGAAEFQRGPAWWYSIMERSYSEAVEKLKATLKDDLKVDPQPLETLPCLVDVSEGKTQEEKERIRRAHRRAARIFANLLDKLVRYRPESRQYAFDKTKQEFDDSRPLWKDYQCTKFRMSPEAKELAESRPSKRNAPIFFNVKEAREQLAKGTVYTLRKERGTGETTARFGGFRNFQDLGRVSVELVKKIEADPELEPYLKESGFSAVKDWRAKASPGADWLYKVVKL